VKIALAALALGLAGIVLWQPAPGAGPEAIRYGREACDHCRMHFAVPGFAAERRDGKGALHKYDDIGCMLTAASHDASGEAWVEDHGGTGFIPLLSATLVKGPFTTPMASGVVAFRDPAAAAAFAGEHAGRLVPLEELLTEVHR
jgi:copper chaperone NosL